MRALVLSGGGAHGAYECGALHWLLRNKEFQYDALYGVSVGALNAAILSMYPHGQEKAAAATLQNTWHKLTQDKIYKEHSPFARIMAIWKNSVVDSSPLHALIDQQYDPVKTIEAKRKLIVGAVSLTTGKYTEFTERDGIIREAIKASSAYPVFFKPVSFYNELWTDGGVRTITPLDSAIASGATEIDVIVTGPKNSTKWAEKNPKTLDIALRVLDLTYSEIMNEDLEVRTNKHPKTKITILRPSKELPGNSLDFNVRDRATMEEIGYRDAQSTWP